jgi:protein-disulfide isomerase
VKRLLLSTALLLAVAVPILADDEEAPAPPQNPKAEKLVSASLPVCSAAMTVKRVGMQHKLPPSFVGTVVRTESERSQCKGQWLSIVTEAGDHYFGMPWFLDEQAKLPTIEEKLKDFTWKNFQTPFEVKIDRTHTRSGLFKVVLMQQYEGGKVPLQGEVDPDGKYLFIGHFSPLGTDITAERLKAFAPYAEKAPAEGGKAPKVTVIEFSDFECPSCKHAAGYLDPILKKYGSDVKYVRYDLPLMMMHPWAFSAALAGRTIYRQKPELFWEYKKQVYENQDKLTAFTIDDFAHNFAADHELDLKKYEADLASPEVRAEILNGIGVAFANNILATPSYVVNGRNVDPGDDGKPLEAYVAKLLNEKVAAK